MKLLETIYVQHAEKNAAIQLLHGNLSEIPGEHGVDILVMSRSQTIIGRCPDHSCLHSRKRD